MQIKGNIKAPRHWLCAVAGEFPAQKASTVENVSNWWRHHVSVHFHINQTISGTDNSYHQIYGHFPGVHLAEIMFDLCQFQSFTFSLNFSKWPGDNRTWHFTKEMCLTFCRKFDDVIKWKTYPRYSPFARGIHRSPVNSPHKGQWRGALMFSLIYAWINGWVNNREAGDLRRPLSHYDVSVMGWTFPKSWIIHVPDINLMCFNSVKPNIHICNLCCHQNN